MATATTIVPFEPKHGPIVALLKDNKIDWNNVTLSPPNDEERKLMSERIDAQQFDAQSPEELFGSDVLHGKDFTEHPFRLIGVDYQRSTIEAEDRQGLPFYAVLKIVTPDGEVRTLICGARSVVKKAAIAANNGWLEDSKRPLWLKITSTVVEENGKPTARRALDLVGAPIPGSVTSTEVSGEEPF